MNDIFDTRRFAVTERDIKNFCELVNNLLEILTEEGCIISEPTKKMVDGLCVYNGEEVKAELKKVYDSEKKQMSKSQLKRQDEELAKRFGMVDERINQFMNRVNASALPLGLVLSGKERQQYIEVENGKATANINAIKEGCTIRMSENVSLANFEEKCRKLWKEICAMDAITRRISGGRVGFIGESNPLSIHIVECYDGAKIHLCLDRLVALAKVSDEDFKKPADFDTNNYLIRDINKQTITNK